MSDTIRSPFEGVHDVKPLGYGAVGAIVLQEITAAVPVANEVPETPSGGIVLEDIYYASGDWLIPHAVFDPRAEALHNIH